MPWDAKSRVVDWAAAMWIQTLMGELCTYKPVLEKTPSGANLCLAGVLNLAYFCQGLEVKLGQQSEHCDKALVLGHREGVKDLIFPDFS